MFHRGGLLICGSEIGVPEHTARGSTTIRPIIQGTALCTSQAWVGEQQNRMEVANECMCNSAKVKVLELESFLEVSLSGPQQYSKRYLASHSSLLVCRCQSECIPQVHRLCGKGNLPCYIEPPLFKLSQYTIIQ